MIWKLFYYGVICLGVMMAFCHVSFNFWWNYCYNSHVVTVFFFFCIFFSFVTCIMKSWKTKAVITIFVISIIAHCWWQTKCFSSLQLSKYCYLPMVESVCLHWWRIPLSSMVFHVSLPFMPTFHPNLVALWDRWSCTRGYHLTQCTSCLTGNAKGKSKAFFSK